MAAASVPPLCVTGSQGPTDYTACQTHWRPQTTSRDVLSPQTRAQISHGCQATNQLQNVRDLYSVVLEDQTEQTR